MGRSIALTLAREGARVVVNYRSSQESAQAIVEHILARGGEAIAVQADVFEEEGCRHLVERAVDDFGQVDICVIGPGAGWHPEPPQQVVAETALEDARRELAPIYHLLPLVLPGILLEPINTRSRSWIKKHFGSLTQDQRHQRWPR